MSPAPPPSRPRSDEFDSDDETRRRMSRIRRRDTRPEQALRRALHARGWRYFVDRPVRGVSRCRPDLLFPRLGVAVFVDGCFWHFCPPHTHLPRANAAYWQAKLLANRQRDARHDDELARAGWRVVRVWEHEPLETALAAVETVLVAARVDLARRRGPAERGRADGPTPARPRRAR